MLSRNLKHTILIFCFVIICLVLNSNARKEFWTFRLRSYSVCLKHCQYCIRCSNKPMEKSRILMSFHNPAFSLIVKTNILAACLNISYNSSVIIVRRLRSGWPGFEFRQRKKIIDLTFNFEWIYIFQIRYQTNWFLICLEKPRKTTLFKVLPYYNKHI